MVIGFLEGSDVMENGVAVQINKQLKEALIKTSKSQAQTDEGNKNDQ